jgi:hypothetical protein
MAEQVYEKFEGYDWDTDDAFKVPLPYTEQSMLKKDWSTKSFGSQRYSKHVSRSTTPDRKIQILLLLKVLATGVLFSQSDVLAE